MSEIKSYIAEIIEELKNGNNQITSLKISSMLNKRYGIKPSVSEVKKIIEELEYEKYDPEEMIESYFILNDSNKIYEIHTSYYDKAVLNYTKYKNNVRNISELLKNIVELDFIPKNTCDIIKLIKNSNDIYGRFDSSKNGKLVLKSKLSEYDDMYKELFNNDCISIDTYYIDCIKLREFIKNMVHLEDREELKFEIGLNMNLLDGNDKINEYELDAIITSVYKNKYIL